ncbi:hypothetical protein GWK08_18670 [Leptobacterium flavescens]|uniref:Uncharacterized protein n=1 Tax=Leptobacterium flavescens TaxID=472055 RepID=A0A6P0UQT5_9FLAO|nr:hypothetical protein [Leptobacterium flavescens]NER15485.1 hypothetical protein [Leptobacterium flavescens]
MKNLLLLFLLAPLLVLSQDQEEYGILENGLIAVHPAKIKQFEEGVAAHNRKFHNETAYGARVYAVSSGPNVGKYVWIMGPQPWSAMENRPKKEGHDEDWNANVLPYVLPEGGNLTYWRFHPELSNFPADFDLNVVKVMAIDVKNFAEPKMMEILKKVHKVVSTTQPEAIFGTYTSELASHDGRDVAWVSFYKNIAMMGQPDKFAENFTKVFGEGSFEKFMKEAEAAIQGVTEEIWTYRQDLSGLNAKIVVQN